MSPRITRACAGMPAFPAMRQRSRVERAPKRSCPSLGCRRTASVRASTRPAESIRSTTFSPCRSGSGSVRREGAAEEGAQQTTRASDLGHRRDVCDLMGSTGPHRFRAVLAVCSQVECYQYGACERRAILQAALEDPDNRRRSRDGSSLLRQRRLCASEMRSGRRRLLSWVNSRKAARPCHKSQIRMLCAPGLSEKIYVRRRQAGTTIR